MNGFVMADMQMAMFKLIARMLFTLLYETGRDRLIIRQLEKDYTDLLKRYDPDYDLDNPPD